MPRKANKSEETKKSPDILIGDLIFATNIYTAENHELILEVEDISLDGKIVKTSKMMLIKKKYVSEGKLDLTPIDNSMILSNFNTSNNQIDSCMCNLDRFDIYGIVSNQKIIDTFRRSFSDKGAN